MRHRAALAEFAELVFLENKQDLLAALAIYDDMIPNDIDDFTKDDVESQKDQLKLQVFLGLTVQVNRKHNVEFTVGAKEYASALNRVYPQKKGKGAVDEEGFEGRLRAALKDGKTLVIDNVADLRKTYAHGDFMKDLKYIVTRIDTVLHDTFLEVVQQELKAGIYEPSGDTHAHRLAAPSTPRKDKDGFDIQYASFFRFSPLVPFFLTFPHLSSSTGKSRGVR